MANRKTHPLHQVHKVDRKRGQWGIRLASCICITCLPKWLWVLTYQGILLSLFLILQTIPCRNDVCTKGHYFDCVPQSFTFYVKLSSVQLLFSFFYSDNAKIISIRQTEEHWETADHIARGFSNLARGFSNACLQLTQILLQLVSLFNDHHYL